MERFRHSNGSKSAAVQLSFRTTHPSLAMSISSQNCCIIHSERPSFFFTYLQVKTKPRIRGRARPEPNSHPFALQVADIMIKWAFVFFWCLRLLLCSSEQRCRSSRKCVGGLEDPITASYFHDYALQEPVGTSALMKRLRHRVTNRAKKNIPLLDFHGDAMVGAFESFVMLCTRPYACDFLIARVYVPL